ncbi:hypothetical protein MRX96_043101 [Rhipicephalus microplus]
MTGIAAIWLDFGTKKRRGIAFVHVAEGTIPSAKVQHYNRGPITWSAVFATGRSPHHTTFMTRANPVCQRIGLRHFNHNVHRVANDVTGPKCSSEKTKTSTDVDKLVLVTT